MEPSLHLHQPRHLDLLACATATAQAGTNTGTYSYFNINPTTGSISLKNLIKDFPQDVATLSIAAEDRPANQPTLWSNVIQVRYDIMSN